MRGAILISISCAVLSAQSVNSGYNIDTIAGSDFNGDNGPATLAILAQAEGIAADKAGNFYIADASANCIRMVNRAGVITTIAGTGIAGFSGDGGPAASAQLNAPYGIVFDGLGNLYVADLGNARVRRIGIDGNITTLAGGGSLPPSPANEGSPATMMMLSAPRNLAFDSQASLYIADFTGQRIYRVDSTGTFTTFAGDGFAGSSGDGGPAAHAQLSYPAGLAFDPSGDLYIADSGNHAIRMIANGRISTFAHAATPTGIVFNLGALYVADSGAGAILSIPANAPVTSLAIPALDLAFDIDGYLYAAQGADVIRVSYSGPGTIVAGGGSLASGDLGPATSALLNRPSGVAVDALGNIFIADHDNNRIRRVAPDGTIATIAGTGEPGNDGDGGPAVRATLNAPSSVAIDVNGNLYIADTGNRRIRRIAPDGTIAAVTFPGLVAPVYCLPDSNGDLFVSDPGSGKILERTSMGQVITLVDHLNSPAGMTFDSNGNLLFADAGAKRVRVLSAANGNLSDIALGFWNTPRAIAIDSAGNTLIADSGLEEIISIDSNGHMTTLAGTGSTGFSGDGGDAASAALSDPSAIAIDSAGIIYIADRGNNRIRRLTPDPATIAAPIQLISLVNAATLQPGPIAPLMLVDIFGTGLTAADLPNARVTFQTDSGDIFAAQILAIDSTKLTFAAPAQVTGSSAQIQILNQSNLIAQIPAAIVPAAPALFADSTGQVSAVNQDGTLNSVSNPAPRGSIAVLYGTGQGVSGLPVSVTIGDYSAEVLYAGPVAAYPGLLQINLQLPSGYIAAGAQSVVVIVGCATSQPGIFINLN